MKKNLHTLFIAAIAICWLQSASAQCDSMRYYRKIFSGSTKTTVVYTDTTLTRQSMDIYTPNGDTATNRRAILLIHGGSFVVGSRTDPFEVYMCQEFAKRGYVTASIDYRLAGSQLDMLDSISAYPWVFKSISDSKAAFRYLKRYASTLGIDTNWIVIGGESAGAIITNHMAYIKSVSECSPLLQTSFAAIGGIEGNSGNTGYTSFNAKAVLNNAGSLLFLGFLDATDHEPIYMAHGTSDHTVPYNCGAVLGGVSDVSTCGSGSMKPVLDSLHIKNMLHSFVGSDHVPWDTNTVDLGIVENETAMFLYQLDCPTFNSVDDVSSVVLGLYPNPASNTIHISTNADMEAISVVDRMGRLVKTISASGNEQLIDISTLGAGIYLAKVDMKANRGSIVKTFIVE